MREKQRVYDLPFASRVLLLFGTESWLLMNGCWLFQMPIGTLVSGAMSIGSICLAALFAAYIRIHNHCRHPRPAQASAFLSSLAWVQKQNMGAVPYHTKLMFVAFLTWVTMNLCWALADLLDLVFFLTLAKTFYLIALGVGSMLCVAQCIKQNHSQEEGW